MAKAYYSTVFEQSAPEIWKIVRDFNNYPVLGGRRRRSQAYEFCGAATPAVAMN